MIHKFQLEKYEVSSKRILEAWVDNKYTAYQNEMWKSFHQLDLGTPD